MPILKLITPCQISVLLVMRGARRGRDLLRLRAVSTNMENVEKGGDKKRKRHDKRSRRNSRRATDSLSDNDSESDIESSSEDELNAKDGGKDLKDVLRKTAENQSPVTDNEANVKNHK